MDSIDSSPANVVIPIVELGFVGMGTHALLWPAAIGRFIDMAVNSVNRRNEVRAVYGG
jgi:hypothetical protein